MAALLPRLVRLDQPLVENYVGRQVPTAMVARNLERGSGLLRPQLDTGPFPNLFVVEPPLFAACTVGLSQAFELPLDSSGRLLSAMAVTVAAAGLFGLVRRRDGDVTALAAAVVFASFPLSYRYGRAFQGDALMLGCLTGAVSLWDSAERERSRSRLAAAWFLLAFGLALKILAAWVLIPLLVAIIPAGRRTRRLPLVFLALVPALAWYVHAAGLLATVPGSDASLDSGRIWLEAFHPAGWLRSRTIEALLRSILYRSFTPFLVPLAVLAWIRARARPSSDAVTDRIWSVWAISALLGLAAVPGKLHHEYYLLALAPPLAVVVARVLVGLGTTGGPVVLLRVMSFAALGLVQSLPTWQLPEEWRSIRPAGREIAHVLSSEEALIASEALLYEAGRRGARLELGERAVVRAAGEWRGRVDDPHDPLALVRFYRSRGLRFVADLPAAPADPSRLALHEALRRDYTVVVDGPDLLLVELETPRDRDRPGSRPFADVAYRP